MKKIKIIGKILLVFLIIFVASSIIYSVPFTDKLFSQIYMIKFRTDAEYVGEETEWSGSFFSKREYRKKTYYDKKNDFEFHLYCVNGLYKNRVVNDDYYKYKLRKEAEDILVEEVIKPVLENDYFVVVKGFRDATKKNTLENSETVADIFTWLEDDFDEIGATVMKKAKENSDIFTKNGGVVVYVFDSKEGYKSMIEYIEKNKEDTRYRNITYSIHEEDFDKFESIIYCYSEEDKWINGIR